MRGENSLHNYYLGHKKFLTFWYLKSIIKVCEGGVCDLASKMGRPKKENPRDKTVHVRFTEEEFARLKEYADKHSESVAQTIRLELDKIITKS